jgi:hypothetical protein
MRILFVVALIVLASPCLAQGIRRPNQAPVVNYSLEELAAWNVAKKLSLDKKPIPDGPPPRQADPDEIPINGFGDVGYWAFEVGSIVDEKNMIVHLGKYTYWVEGYQTNELADDQSIRILDPVQYVGSKKYTTVLGGTKQVRHLRVRTSKEIANEIQKEREKRFKEWREEWEEHSETFKLNGKDFRARLVSSKNSYVTFQDANGEEVRHLITKFDESSQLRLKELIKKLPKTKTAGKK